MIEALRGLGYSTATALADVVDNSVSAGADHVDVFFSWKGVESSVSVLDNGRGMDDAELDRAMRLGEKSPLEDRSPEDLGRFGLGLKTASFSQCRQLTVASRKQGTTNCLRWDLDVLAASNDDGWHLLEGPGSGSEGLLTSLGRYDHGTLVLWEKLDRIVTKGFSEQDFLDLIDGVEAHLALVLHRLLAGPQARLCLSINSRPIVPSDPFLTSHTSTWSSPIERILTDSGTITIQCYVLPHRDRLDLREYEAAAGPNGWTAQQGFYVYRNERLLVPGSWLGLGRGRSWTKEEAHRLARIRLDITNSADADWKLDIRKSIARPPVLIRDRLTRLAEDTRERARRVFAHRGELVRVGTAAPVAQAWRAEHFKGGIRYRIDTTHPAVNAVLDDAGSLTPQIRAMLRVIEETIPVQRIWLDTTEARETPRTSFAGAERGDVDAVLRVIYRNMVVRKVIAPATARQQLLRTDPFHNYPDLVAALPDEPPLEK